MSNAKKAPAKLADIPAPVQQLFDELQARLLDLEETVHRQEKTIAKLKTGLPQLGW